VTTNVSTWLTAVGIEFAVTETKPLLRTDSAWPTHFEN